MTQSHSQDNRDWLLGKVALVTGGASGIGESITRLFHIHGAKICIADLQDDLGNKVSESLGGEENVCFFHCDVTRSVKTCGFGLHKECRGRIREAWNKREPCVTVFRARLAAHLPEDERTDDAKAGFVAFMARNANLQGVELPREDVANAVLFLASDEAKYISGVNLMVDGGFTSVNHSLKVVRI
ncbi:Zeaxanthin epoxidase, chloroplastic [Stylosanthes scabra]|uniref:Zeaxanthin epoxidase, chloroplastic n=1 Tax=Stylosanthes scabra TaxID=79078 RepID=A0ABU6UT67_9FABA|nr:Zeaxanthin epoxidase, chloroplastic [Stylosanthes scabra]